MATYFVQVDYTNRKCRYYSIRSYDICRAAHLVDITSFDNSIADKLEVLYHTWTHYGNKNLAIDPNLIVLNVKIKNTSLKEIKELIGTEFPISTAYYNSIMSLIQKEIDFPAP